MFILMLLLVVSVVVPLRLAFSDEESESWFIFYTFGDFCFFLDIIFTFFTSVPDRDNIYEICDKKQIAVIYLKGWFWVDLVSILPLDSIFLSESGQGTVIARFARIGKLYKILRMIRLAKVLKLLKSK